MKVPKRVKVGAMTYDVNKVKRPVTLGSKVCYGTISYDELIIELDDRYPEQKLHRTFLHELLHAIAVDRGIELGEQEEEIVDAFAIGLYALIVDNPQIFK